MQQSIVRQAEKEFLQGNFHSAIALYKKIANEIGEQYFKANVLLCERRLSQIRTMSEKSAIPLSCLKVAAVMDDFSHHAFSPECQLLSLSADGWKAQVEEFEPDLVFIESAWRGVDESWQRKVSDYSSELRGLIDWAKRKGIATAFWSKEDPVHYSRFLPVARLASHVFTTDIDCIAKYKRVLGHDRVYLLPFAAQPALHNPIETVERRDGFSFAGSWYSRYAERQTNFRTLVGVARKLKWIEIYDRNGDRPLPHDFAFPEEFHGEIKGALPYTEMDKAYRGCRYGITVNTVKQSQTMFARRALELMACNTIVVSNYSKGLRQFFGDLVIASDSYAELEHRLADIVSDEVSYRKLRLQALRKVLAEHTYQHRLAYVAEKVLERPTAMKPSRVAIIAEMSSAKEGAQLLATFERQLAKGVVLLLVGPSGVVDHPKIEVFDSRSDASARANDFDFVAPISAVDYYGSHYLSDLILATTFSGGDGITKRTYYETNTDGSLELRNPGCQYIPVNTAACRRSLLRPQLLRVWVEDPALALQDAVVDSNTLVAVDEFSYCANGASHPDQLLVDAQSVLRVGMSLVDEILPWAEAIQPPENVDGLSLEVKKWFPLLPKGIDGHIDVQLAEPTQVIIKSSLPADTHKYLYLNRLFRRSELGVGQYLTFVGDGDAQMGLSVVLVFQNERKEKISHVMVPLAGRDGIALPADAVFVRIALRIQGAGSANVGRLFLNTAASDSRTLLPSARNLVVVRHYPSYDDIYRYGFVHARVRAYQKSGVATDVVRIASGKSVFFREFENIDVVESEIKNLDACLAGGRYNSVSLHIVDRMMWDVVQKYLGVVRVVIWAHGSEIQPWWRREMNHPADQIDVARRDADSRMDMWREILSLSHPNLHVIFISEKQASEGLSDLRLSAAATPNLSVVHNFIDGDLFKYREKRPEQRFHLLSVRPFASSVYANDLTVRAIQLLAKEPFFELLRIRIVGDGPLFEQTVAPLRSFKNVELHQGFLTQREIARLHQESGVFIVPSRMDSQGVSRDEAMASGLVPITTKIAAIPEFVDESCAFLAGPEDAEGLAAAVCRLVNDPDLFTKMSRAAALRVRSQSNYACTISRELALLTGTNIPGEADSLQRIVAREERSKRIALYGDVNLNVMDGSAIWAASFAEVLGLIDGIRVSLVLKSRIQRTQIISRLLDLTPSIQLIEPQLPVQKGLTPNEALDWIIQLDGEQPFSAVVLRGLEVCHRAAQSSRFVGRIWAYLTDIPQQANQMNAEVRSKIDTIIAASEFILCQTPQMRDYFVGQFPQVKGRAKLVPPMIPSIPKSNSATISNTLFRYCYAGKFAPRWGIREMFHAHSVLLASQHEAELHIFGDKIHNPPDDPKFYPSIRANLTSSAGVFWHGAVDRNELLRRLPTMHACWAFRDPHFERETLELSTKVLEYALLGVPMILARSPVLEGVLGTDYPLFAESAEEANSLLKQVSLDLALRKSAAQRLSQVASQYTFEAVRQRLIAEGLFDL
ncbi:glycosyltransferase [Achromobacter sp. ES-001]|uniref:glycosyltransferase family protein n=1 Tax=Achromobacter sp. ES-001 TaxID=2860286 RepID=UPI001C63D8BF|nr:glycosyltransferase [Achromobacter sp. ES-001]QYJ24177.1 glycosyltransferase [Achromobacter sp. ES-001]